MLGLSLGPVAEELFFCGWLLRSIEDALGGRRSFAALACAFAFAAVRPPVLLVPFFVLGVVASLLASRSRSIGPGVVAHVLHNGVTLLATSVF